MGLIGSDMRVHAGRRGQQPGVVDAASRISVSRSQQRPGVMRQLCSAVSMPTWTHAVQCNTDFTIENTTFSGQPRTPKRVWKDTRPWVQDTKPVLSHIAETTISDIRTNKQTNTRRHVNKVSATHGLSRVCARNLKKARLHPTCVPVCTAKGH